MTWQSVTQPHSRTGSRSALESIQERVSDEEAGGSGKGSGSSSGESSPGVEVERSGSEGSGSGWSGRVDERWSAAGVGVERSGGGGSGQDALATGVLGGAAGGIDGQRDSLEAIKIRVMKAKKFELKKGVAATIKAEGLKMSELIELADNYDETHLDFDGG